MSRVLQDLTELQAIALRCRSAGLTLGMCHGCFDIVHLGHVHHLKQASEQVDRLFVSITADDFVNKGPDRPIFTARSRAEFITSIRYCDYAVISPAATAEQVLCTLLPDVFFKGADYKFSKDPRLHAERLLVEKGGGCMFLTDEETLDSTSRIAQLIVAREK